MNSTKKVLPINQEPLLHCYSHEADFFAINSATRKRSNIDIVLENLNWLFSTSLNQEYQVLTDGCTLKIVNDSRIKNIIINQLEKPAQEITGFMYQCVEGQGSLVVKIDTFPEETLVSQVGIMITTEEDKLEDCNNVKVGFAALNHILIKQMNQGVLAAMQKYENIDQCKWLKVEKTDKGFEFYISANGNNWISVYAVNWPFDRCLVGVYIYLPQSSFKEWLFSNYIQIHCAASLDGLFEIPIDYYSGIRNNGFWENGMYNLCNPWLKQNIVDWNLIKDTIDINTFINKCIDQGKYVQIKLNEYYIADRRDYKERYFMHPNLIYGYDLEEGCYYVMGYNNNGKYTSSKLSFDDFKQSFDSRYSLTEHFINILQNNMPLEQYSFNIEHVKQYLYEYVNSINSSTRNDIQSNPLDRIFGVQVYDVMIKNFEKLEDHRITFLIHEHKQLMLLRLTYFYEKGYINKVHYENLMPQAEQLEKKTNILMLAAIHYQMAKVRNSESRDAEKLKAKILDIKQLDITFTNALITALS